MTHSLQESTAAVAQALVSRRPDLVRAVRRVVGPHVDAEDIVQSASQRALERAGQLRDLDRAEAWISRVVRNVLTDELRQRKAPTDDVDGMELAAPEAEAVACACVVGQAEQLKPEYAEILRRVVIDGAPVVRVAQELGLTANNATVRLHRARKALRAQLESHCGDDAASACLECACGDE